jgi:hypothetical protein
MAVNTVTVTPRDPVSMLERRLSRLEEELGIRVVPARHQLEIALNQRRDGDEPGARNTAYAAFSLTFEPQQIVLSAERAEGRELLRRYESPEAQSILDKAELILSTNRPDYIRAHLLVRKALEILREIERGGAPIRMQSPDSPPETARDQQQATRKLPTRLLSAMHAKIANLGKLWGDPFDTRPFEEDLAQCEKLMSDGNVDQAWKETIVLMRSLCQAVLTEAQLRIDNSLVPRDTMDQVLVQMSEARAAISEESPRHLDAIRISTNVLFDLAKAEPSRRTEAPKGFFDPVPEHRPRGNKLTRAQIRAGKKEGSHRGISAKERRKLSKRG